jgi:succinyldiaminopimelate transaminase
LSVGTPVDPTPDVIQRALRESADAPGYPPTIGTPALQDTCVGWLNRSLDVQVTADAILPVIGSKEFIAQLPTLLGFTSDNTVAIPSIAYPTYAVGAAVAGCRVVDSDAGADLTWVNSPSNPTGEVLPPAALREVVARVRRSGGLVVSDECYIELGWGERPTSILHASVVGHDHSQVLALHSLSKRSNMAGYRFGFLTGDSDVIAGLRETRKHLGGMVPAPIQAAAIAAFSDDQHVATQRERYRKRREILLTAVSDAGFVHTGGDAGLYLWVTRDEPCWDSVRWFADRGIVVAPGDFYGAAGASHVRIALTASDHDVSEAARRITAPAT